MKKIRSILPIMLSCLFAFTFALAACSDDEEGENSSGDSTTYATLLDSISVNVSGAKTSFLLGEEFTSDGLVVTATTSVNYVQSSAAITDYEVDSSEYDNTKVGTYTIYIKYSLPDTVAESYATYNVTVSADVNAIDAIAVTYSGSRQLDYSTEGVTINLSSDLITAKREYGDTTDSLTEADVTDYIIKYSCDSGTLETVSGSSITADKAGTYSFYIYQKDADGSEDKNIKPGQFCVYVVDTVTSIEWNNDGTTTYDYGSLEIGDDWTYTATFKSGATSTITASDVDVTAKNTSGDNQSATVKYTYSCRGYDDDATDLSSTASTSVTYSVSTVTFGDIVGFNTNDISLASDFSAVEYDAGSVIATNDVFTLSSSVATLTSLDKNNALISSLSTKPTYTDRSGASVTPAYGIKMYDTFSADSDTGTVFTVTATQACEVTVYLSLADNGFGSHRPGTIYYTLNGKTFSTAVTKRSEVVEVTVALKKDQTVSIGAINTGSSAAKLWLWGAQAQAITEG